MPAEFAATYEATPQSVGVVRNQMATLAQDCGLDEAGVGDVRLAVSEAATNALMHGYGGEASGIIRVRAAIVDGELLIAVRDEGGGLSPRADSPGLGLGLPVIASVAHRFEIVDKTPGTELRMTFRCPRGAALGGQPTADGPATPARERR